MGGRFILTDYVEAAIARARIEALGDGTFAASIAECPGVLAFGESSASCHDELRATLEDWILLGLKLNHPIPVIDNIDLNASMPHEPVDAL